MLPNQRLLPEDGMWIDRKQLRRTSSLQIPLPSHSSNMFATAFTTLKNSTASMYTSTLSVAGLFSGRRHRSGDDDDSLGMNLYTLMAKYRCCCGLCRLRVGSFIIAVFSILYPLAVITCLVFNADWLNDTQKKLLVIPIIVLMVLQLLTSTLMLIGLFSDSHYFMLPFQFSCVINMMASMGLGIILLISTDRSNTQFYPAFAVLSTALVSVYLWFLVICSMTFVLIRDKKRLTDSMADEFGAYGDIDCPTPHIERSFTFKFNKMNFAILLFLAITTPNFADANPISETNDLTMSDTPANLECLENNEAGEELAKQCFAGFISRIEKLAEEPDFVKGKSPQKSARVCPVVQELYECIHNIIVESCGRDEATHIAKEIFREMDFSKVADNSVPECKQLEDYIESGGAETTDSSVL
ncbi:hypothetical protein DdX_11275 [Ditylenchus destructor]|uniref:Uncharacterized protein n=1 Tax=Ditylenchus destructor TaxID=166010 RepID=A0AAD4MYG1_9BILA|nr:hypothetical protein DdX_11275 [Ditylenchus destructor]